jgi:LPS-assembly protein
MSKSIIKTIVVFSSIFLLALSAFATEVDIAAENLEYIGADGKIIARDNVTLNWEDRKIYADNAELDINTKTVNAYGNVKVEELEGIIRANALSYDYNDETGDMDETFACSSSVFIRSESMEKVDKDTFALHNVKLSICDLDEPHTYFKAKRGKFIVDKKIIIYKATLYVGKMPIFYVPVFIKSLEKGKKGFGSNLRYEIMPGITPSSDNFTLRTLRDRFTLRAFIACSLTENIYGKLKYDHPYKKCNDWGVEVDYESDDGSLKGDLGAYLGNNDKKKNWRVKPSYFHKLNDQWTLRYHVNAQNAERFTKKYPDSIESSANLTRHGNNTNLSVDFNHNAHYDKESCMDYKMLSAKLPKVTFSIYGKDIGMGIIHSPKWEYEYSHDYDYARRGKQSAEKKCCFSHKALIGHELTTSLKILKDLTLKPGVEVTGNICSKDKVGNCKVSCYTQYGGSLIPEYKLTDWMSLRATYKYKARTKPNSFLGDVDSDDKGVETKKLDLVNKMDFSELEFCDSDTFEITNTISYDWLDQTSYYSRWGLNSMPKQHLSPLKTELDWKPKDSFISSLKVQERHHLHPNFKFKDFELEAQIGNLKKNYLTFGVNLEKNTSDMKTKRALGVKNTFGIGGWINPKWRIDYKISIDFSDKETNKVTDRITEHEFKIYRDTHCWDCGIVWSKHKSLAFKFNLKTNMPFFNKSEDTLDAEDSEEIFYPWNGEMHENFFDF